MINFFLQKALAQGEVIVPLPGNLVKADDAEKLLSTASSIVFGFLAVMAVVGILYSGVMMITSGGDASKFEVGKKNLLWSIIGIIVVVLAYFITTFVYSLVGGDNGLIK